MVKQTITIHGIPIKVLPVEEWELVDAVLCMRVGSMAMEPYVNPHNIPSNCDKCGHAVYRDGRGPKKPVSICHICAGMDMPPYSQSSHAE